MADKTYYGYDLLKVESGKLTGNSYMAVRFPFINYIHHFIRAGDKAFCTTLSHTHTYIHKQLYE